MLIGSCTLPVKVRNASLPEGCYRHFIAENSVVTGGKMNRIMESIAVCVRLNWPVLLCGEAGECCVST